MTTSRIWYYSITDDEDSKMIPQAMRILDEDATHADHVSEVFMGLGAMVVDLPLKDTSHLKWRKIWTIFMDDSLFLV